MTNAHERRRKFLIDKRIQFSFLRATIISILLVSAFFGFFILKINDYLTDTLVMHAEREINLNFGETETVEPKGRDLRDELKKRDIIFMLQIVIAIFLMSLLVGFYTIRFSHRIAGPVFRIKRCLEEFISGNNSVRVYLRKNDFLHDLAEKFNQLMDRFEKEGKK
ncbi:hypothetical protein ACFL1T_01435 [Chlamydiota bacterium]